MQRTQDGGWHLPEAARDSRKGTLGPYNGIFSLSPDPTAPWIWKLAGAEALDCPYSATESSSNNSILAGLPPEEFSHLRDHLQHIRFQRGHLFYDVAAPIDLVCFPLAGMIGLFAAMHDGRTVALTATGREGFLGVPILLGGEVAYLRAVALMEGTALTLERNQLSRILSSAPQLSAGLRRYCAAHLRQVVQIGACHALHNVPQRVAMWLLMVYDRSNSDSLPLTHESLSEMLGCRRSSISEALSLLRKARAIRGGRGHIQIADRVRLTEQSCECYTCLH